MARIGPSHRCQDLDHALCSIFATGKVFHISDQNIRIAAHMQMTALAFHIDAAGLLRHSVVIPYIEDPADFPESVPEFLCGHRLLRQLLPAAAMDQETMFQMKPVTRSFQRLIKIFPDHIGKPEYKDQSVTGLLKKCLHSLEIQRHIFLQRITAF